jgi:CRP/FNR family cyclic AMP-dependent transcriptional regulator
MNAKFLAIYMADLLFSDAPGIVELMPEALARRVRAAARPTRYRDGQLIHARGDLQRGLSIVRSGAVRFGNAGDDGSYVTTTVMGPGQSFGEFTLFGDLPRTHDATAVGVTVIDSLDHVRVNRLLVEAPELWRILLVATTKRLHDALELLDDFRRLPLPALAAKLLLTLPPSKQDPAAVACNQADLAFSLGVSRVSIGKALAHLQKEKLLVLGYRTIRIRDRAALKRWLAKQRVLSPVTSA